MLKNIILILHLNLCLLVFGQKGQTDFSGFFSASEIEDLNLIVDFFQMELCGSEDRTRFSSCFVNSIPSLLDYEQNYLEKKISWRKQKKLYTKISNSTFQKIWSLCKVWRTIEPKYEYKEICFSYNETFIDFVKSLEEDSPLIKAYSQKLENLGTFPFWRFFLINIIEYPESIDLENRGVQTLIAIHFLTLNDQAKRDKKAKRLENRDLRKKKRNLKRNNKQKN
jgi:hypothetical protein